MACNTFTLRTADIQEIFYFNNYHIGEEWEDDPEKMVDGIMYNETIGQYSFAATFNNNIIQLCDKNSSPTDRSTIITKVELRTYSYARNSNGTLTAHIRPVFTAGDGDIHSWLPASTTDLYLPLLPEWGAWIDITNDTNAPSIWTWNDINNLDAEHWMTYTFGANPDTLVTGRIEIRVTWHDFVILNYPLENSLDSRLDKQLKQFNLWKDYKLHDESIAGQPLNFKSIEVGTDAQATQEKFAKIHSWIESHYNIKLTEFGNCFDTEYAIKNFTVQSMKHPSNYAWKLSLEKAA